MHRRGVVPPEEADTESKNKQAWSHISKNNDYSPAFVDHRVNLSVSQVLLKKFEWFIDSDNSY